MDYNFLSRKILAILKSGKSQKKLSRQLGYDYDIIYRWEAGTKKFLLSDLYQLSKLRNIEMDTLHFCFLSQKNGYDIFGKVVQFFGPQDIKSLSRILNISPATTQRWIHGKHSIEVEHFIQYLHQSTNVFVDFLLLYFSLEQLESFVGSEKMAIVNSKRLYGDFPPAALVRAALDTQKYKTSKNLEDIAAVTRLPIEDVRAAHKELLKDPDLRDAKRESEIDRMHFSIKSSARLARYLTQKSLQRFENPSEIPVGDRQKDYWGYCVASASAEAQIEIQKILAETKSKIDQILEHDLESEKTDIKILLLHYFNPTLL